MSSATINLKKNINIFITLIELFINDKIIIIIDEMKSIHQLI